MMNAGDTTSTSELKVVKVDLSGPLPRVDLDLLPEVDNSQLPQSTLSRN